MKLLDRTEQQQPQQKTPAPTAEAGKYSRRDDVINKSSTSFHLAQLRPTPDSGVDMTDTKSCRDFDEHAFEHTFHGFPSPLQTSSVSSTNRSSSANRSSTNRVERSWFSGCQFSGPTKDGHFRTSAKSTLIHNGHCTVISRDALNGDELVVVEEDGVVTTKTHNGHPCVTSV